MFKGFKKEFQIWVEKFNQNSDEFFILSLADLELVEINGKRRKCRLISNELSERIREKINVPSVKFIEFDFDDGNGRTFSNPPYHCAYQYWLEINKQEKLEINLDRVLNISSSSITPFPALHLFDGSSVLFEEKIRETESARIWAIHQIEETIRNGNIDLDELIAYEGDYRDSYIHNRPIDCLHCGIISPDEVKEYYKTHINKCIWRPDRINDFKDNLISLIQRKITEFNTYKIKSLNEIIQKAEGQGITKEELNTTRPNWQNHLLSLKNRKEIENYQTTQLEQDIQNLVSAKNKSESERQQAEKSAQETAQKEEERLKKEQAEREKKAKEEQTKKETEEKVHQEAETKKKVLENQKTNSITKITVALNQEPELKNSDLSSEYQNWETKINGLTELNQVIDWESKVLIDIQARKKDKKTAQETKENLNQFQNPDSTPQQKQAALNNLQRNEGERAYEEQKEQINQAKETQATQNPTEYSQNAADKIVQKMQEEGISEADLSDRDDQTKNLLTSLKDGKIKDPTKIVQAENEIRQAVWQTKVEKEVHSLTQEVDQVLQTNKKEDITKIKQKLIEFLAKSNVYYTSQHQRVQELLTKLENYSNTNQQNNNLTSTTSSPWKIILPLFLIGILLLSIGLMALKAKRLSRIRKGKSKRK